MSDTERTRGTLSDKILLSLTPTVVAVAPGAALLFYYQIHIGNLPAFVTQSNPFWMTLSVSLTVTLIYGMMLVFGMCAAFWLYAGIVTFFGNWEKVAASSGNGTFPWARVGPAIAYAVGRAGTIVRAACPLAGGVILIGAAVLILWLGAEYLLIWSRESAAVALGLLLDTVAGAFFHSGHHITPKGPIAAHLSSSASWTETFAALLVSNTASAAISTYVWYRHRQPPTLHGIVTLRNGLPHSDRAWCFYLLVSLGISLICALTTSIAALFSQDRVLVWSLLGVMLSALLPVALWRLMLGLPPRRVPVRHNLYPNEAASVILYSFVSIFISFFFIIVLSYNININGFLGFILYFYIVGFLTITFLDTVPREKIKKGSMLLLLLPFFFSLFPGSWATLSRECMSVAGFHTWRQDVVLVTPELAKNISGVLSMYGLEADTCATTIADQPMTRLSVTVNGTNLPLQVLWNDGTEKRLLGFDTERIRYPRPGPTLFIPPTLATSSDITELTAGYLIPCTES